METPNPAGIPVFSRGWKPTVLAHPWKIATTFGSTHDGDPRPQSLRFPRGRKPRLTRPGALPLPRSPLHLRTLPRRPSPLHLCVRPRPSTSASRRGRPSSSSSSTSSSLSPPPHCSASPSAATPLPPWRSRSAAPPPARQFLPRLPWRV